MRKKIRWGIIGPGVIAHRFAAALRGVPDAELVAISARSAEKGKQFAAEFEVPLRFDHPEALAACTELDAVYVATPHPLHYTGALAALEAGKAVLCEKPITINAVQLRKLIEVARARRAFLMEAMWTRFLPVTRQVVQWLTDGEIGKRKMIYADFCFSCDFNPDSRLFAPELGGGALLDVGIYPLSYAQMLAGNPESVSGAVAFAPTGVDGCNALLLKFPDQTLALLSSAIQSQSSSPARICGTEGEIVIPDFWSAQSASVIRRGEKTAALHCEHPHRINGFEYEIEEVQLRLRNGELESPIMPLADSLKLQEIMDQLRADWGLHYPGE